MLCRFVSERYIQKMFYSILFDYASPSIKEEHQNT